MATKHTAHCPYCTWTEDFTAGWKARVMRNAHIRDMHGEKE